LSPLCADVFPWSFDQVQGSSGLRCSGGKTINPWLPFFSSGEGPPFSNTQPLAGGSLNSLGYPLAFPIRWFWKAHVLFFLRVGFFSSVWHMFPQFAREVRSSLVVLPNGILSNGDHRMGVFFFCGPLRHQTGKTAHEDQCHLPSVFFLGCQNSFGEVLFFSLNTGSVSPYPLVPYSLFFFFDLDWFFSFAINSP